MEGAIARGGFGVVHRATHAETSEPVAIKVMHAEIATSPMVVARFEREVEAIRRVRHPNVVQVFDQGSLDDGRPYFVMELLSGESLRQHLDDRGRLPPGEALAILDPLCRAIAAAHERSVVHRDVKASNVMLARDGAARRVVLLDFGVAKLLDSEGPKLTASRHAVGSLSCMAPEQIMAKPVDERTDVYALGVLAYRMLTGEMPFAARTILEMQHMHLSAAPRAPSAVARVGPFFDNVVLRALAKAPGARPPSVLAFLDELRAAVAASEASRPTPRRVLAVLVEVRVEPDAFDAATEGLFEDMEGIFPTASRALAPLGLSTALETGTTLLLAVERPDDPDADARLRSSAVATVASLHERLSARAGADPAIDVRLYVHMDTLVVDPTGEAVGGALLALDAWLPDLDVRGALVSNVTLAGLALLAVPLAGVGEGWAVVGG